MIHQYKVVRNSSQLNRLIENCNKTRYACVDFETTGTRFYRKDEYPTILAVSFQPGSSWIIPLKHKDSPFKNRFKKVLRKFGRKVIENPNITKIAWNFQFELKWFYKYNIFPKGRLFDAMLAKYTLDETRPNDLKSMVTRFLPEFSQYEKEIEFLTKKHGWENVPFDDLCKYAALDADMEFRLYLMFEDRMIKKGLYPLFRNLLMMGSRVLSESEFNGFHIHMDKLYEVRDLYKEKIEKCERELRHNPTFYKYEKRRIKQAKKDYVNQLKAEIKVLESQGKDRQVANREAKITNFITGVNLTQKELKLLEPFNFGSPAQLKDFLFLSERGLKFEVVKYTTDKYKNETDNPSTDEEVLEKLSFIDKSGFINHLLEYRGLLHIRNNFIDSFIEKAYKGKLYGSFLLHGTVSGRLSSRNPNLQQIPRITTNPYIKPLFLPSPGKVILHVDYSQAELRVLAALARETEMLKWFKEGRDIHLASACKKYKEDYDIIVKIYKDESHPEYIEWSIRRKQAKTINFGIVYGQGAKHLSESLSTPENPVSQEQAQRFLDEFFRDFPRIRRYIKKQHKLAKENGYVSSPFGRKRRLPEIYSINWAKKAEAQRQSVNAVIQGCASDYTLFSSILIWEAIKKGDLPSSIKQLATVHDSIIYEIEPKDLDKAIPIMTEIFENPETKQWFNFELKGIKMSVDFEVGSNWGSLKTYKPGEDYTSLINPSTIYYK